MIKCTAICNRCETPFNGGKVYENYDEITIAMELAGWEFEDTDTEEEHYCNSCAAVEIDEREQEPVEYTINEYGFWPFMHEYGFIIIVVLFILFSGMKLECK